MCNTDPTTYRRSIQAPAKGKQFLPLIRQPSCSSYSQYVLDTTMRKQTQIRDEASIQRRNEHRFYGEIVADITTRNSERMMIGLVCGVQHHFQQ